METFSVEIEIGMMIGVREIFRSIVYKPPNASIEDFTKVSEVFQ